MKGSRERTFAYRGRGQSGIALVLVLWVVTLMTVMALSMTATVRTDSQLTRNRLDEARIRALSDAAVAMAMLRLESAAEDDRWWPDGEPHLWRFAGQTLEVRVFNESSRIDLNAATGDRLQKLLEAVGVEAVAAQELVAVIEDWRDRDDSVRMGGAEAAEYRAAGLPYGSRNGKFNDVAELTQLLGVSMPLYRALAPYLTVDGQGGRVDEEYASGLVRSVVEGESAVSTGRLRRRPPSDARQSSVERRRGLGGPIYRVRVSGAGGGPSVETLARRGAGPGGLFHVLSRRMAWRPGGAQAPP